MTAIELLLILASAVAMLWAAVGITDARALRRSRTGLPQQKHLHVGAARADGGRHRRYGGGL